MYCEPHLSLVRYEPDAVMDIHVHAEASVSVVLAGSIFEVVGCREEFGNVGDAVVKPPGTEHRNRVGPGGAVLLAIKSERSAGAVARGWRWTHNNHAGAMGLRIAAFLLNEQLSHAHEAAHSLLWFFAEKDEAITRACARDWLRLIRDRIEDDRGSSSVAELAKIAGVHPGSLTRAFRRHYGCSVSTYIRRVRVRHAAALLVKGDRTVSDIAAAVGCYDQSHLCREFNLELGTSPSSYRRTMTGWRFAGGT
jgi:AraC family transcriptional regulator